MNKFRFIANIIIGGDEMFEKRTDLAVEAHELYRQSEKSEHVPGVTIDTEKLEKLYNP